MRKRTLGIIVILIIILFVVFAWPYMMGGMFKKQVYRLQDSPNAFKNMTVKVLKYHGGWAHSTAELQLTVKTRAALNQAMSLPNAAQLPKDFVFDVQLNVAHGPLAKLKQSLTTKHWFWGRGAASGTIKLVSPAPSTLPQYPILAHAWPMQAWMHWGGRITTETVDKPGVVIKNLKHTTVSIGEIDQTSNISSDLSKVTGRSAIHQLLIQQHHTKCSAPQVNVQFDMSHGLAGLWYGQKHLQVDSLSCSKKMFSLARLNSIDFKLNSALTKTANLSISNVLTVKSIEVMGQKVGPLNFDLLFNNIRPESVAAIYKKLDTLNSKHWVKPPAHATDKQLNAFEAQRAKDVFNALQPSIIEFLTGAHVTLNTLQLQTDQGLVKVTGDMIFPVQIPGTVNDPNAVLNMLKTTTAQTKLMVPVVLADELAGFMPPSDLNGVEKASPLDSALKQGLIVKQGSSYVTHLHYDGQSLTVNGKSWQAMFPKPKPKPKPHPKPVVKAVAKPASAVKKSGSVSGAPKINGQHVPVGMPQQNIAH